MNSPDFRPWTPVERGLLALLGLMLAVGLGGFAAGHLTEYRRVGRLERAESVECPCGQTEPDRPTNPRGNWFRWGERD